MATSAGREDLFVISLKTRVSEDGLSRVKRNVPGVDLKLIPLFFPSLPNAVRLPG